MEVASVQRAGGLLAQARMRGDKEAEREAEQLLAEARLRVSISKAKGLLSPDAIKRLCELLMESAAAA